MTDVHDKDTRSRNMAAIKSKNTTLELWLRKRLHAKGFRYRVNAKILPGKPDIVLTKYKAVIFIHGCFWHMHDCPLFVLPKSRTTWWNEKLKKNQNRDQDNINKLHDLDWRILIVWECAIKGRLKLSEDDVIRKTTTWIHSDNSFSEIKGIN